MTTKSHTPGPWHVCYDGQIDAGSAKNNPPDYKMICRFGTSTYKEMIDSGDLDNARFIVRACNAHEELLDALQKCLGILNEPPVSSVANRYGYKYLLAEIQAAIQKTKTP